MYNSWMSTIQFDSLVLGSSQKEYEFFSSNSYFSNFSKQIAFLGIFFPRMIHGYFVKINLSLRNVHKQDIYAALENPL